MARPDKKIKVFGEVLHHGVWIYVADVKQYRKRIFIYVGKTGRKRVPEGTSPWGRLAAHLDDDSAPHNCLLYHLRGRNVDPDSCVFEMSCFGPDLLEKKVADLEEHEIIEEAEFQLFERIRKAGYPVVGDHTTRPQHYEEAKTLVDEIVDTLKASYLKNLK